MGTDTHVPDRGNVLKRHKPTPRDSFAHLGLGEQDVLNSSPTPMLLVKGINTDPTVVWANGAFYKASRRSESVAGSTLSGCKITLRQENPVSGEVSRWTPRSEKSAGKGTQYGALPTPGSNPYSLIDPLFGLTSTPINLWTCDFETVEGHWIVTQACVSSVARSHASDHEQMWLIQILPAGETAIAHNHIENSAAAALDGLSEISTLLTDVEHPNILRGIADILVETTPSRWAGFFLGGGPFRHSDGIIAAQDLETFEAPSNGNDVRSDLIARILSGTEVGAVEFQTDRAYREGSLSFLMQQAILATWHADAFEQQGPVTVQGIAGRNEVHGILVCAYPLHNEYAEEFTVLDVSSEALKVNTTVSRRVGMAIDNVSLYQREHHLAQTLQQSMLPTQVEIRGLDVWTYYAPSSDHAKVGGDWYDILPVDDLTVGIVVGDVVGHDLEAAATMGQLRSITLPYAFEIDSPEQVLEKVDRLVSRLDLSRQASMVYAKLSRKKDIEASESAHWEMEYSRAGHLPPILVRNKEGHILAGGAGTLIGFNPTDRTKDRVELEPDDLIVFYTDGLIERRNRPMQAGLAELQQAVTGLRISSAGEVGEQLLGILGNEPEDDVAMVIVRVPSPQEPDSLALHSSHSFDFEPVPHSVALARRALAQSCQEWDVPKFAAAELVVSELVANAVKHGWGPVTLRLSKSPAAMRIEVGDSNPAGPLKLDGHADRTGGFGIKIVDRLSQWSWRETHGGKVIVAEVPFENSLDR